MVVACCQEHFLFVQKRAETRQPAALIVNLGGPYESSPRDRLWQDWALRFLASRGISFFYDGLNPRSGVGGVSLSRDDVDDVLRREDLPHAAARQHEAAVL